MISNGRSPEVSTLPQKWALQLPTHQAASKVHDGSLQTTTKKCRLLRKIESNLNRNDTLPTVIDEEKEALEDHANGRSHPSHGAFKFASISATILTLLIDFIIPIPMFLSHYVFSRGSLTGWVVVSLIWVFFALGSCAILPVWEAAGFFGVFGRK